MVVVPNSRFGACLHSRIDEDNQDWANSRRLFAAPTTSACDIALQLLDNELLVGDDGFDEVTDRDDADYFSFVDDRKMADAFIRHYGHTFFDRLLQVSVGHMTGHYFLDPSVRGGSAKKDNLSSVVSLGDDAGEPRTVHDHESADFLLGHAAQRLEYRRTHFDTPNGLALDL
jgi:hypothetical protein